MNRRNLWTLTLLSLLVLGSGWVWMNRVSGDRLGGQNTPQPAVDHPAPAMALDLLSGESLSLAELKGQPVIVNFWATWCGPCREEMPLLEETARRFDGQLTILGVDQGEDAATVQDFVDELGVTFPILMDTEMTTASDFNVRGLPTTFFIDADGIIQQIYPGQLNGAILIEGIQKIQ